MPNIAKYMQNNLALHIIRNCITSGAIYPMVARKPAGTASGFHSLSIPLHTFGRSFCIPDKS